MTGYRQPPLYVSPHRSVPSSAVPLVQVMDAEHGPWTNNPNFGANIPFAADANNRQKILKLDEWGPPSEWTLSLGMYYNESSAPANINFRIIADVSIGVGGATQDISLDLVRGVKLSATMNAVQVVYRYSVDFSNPFPLNVPPDLRLTALLSKGCRAGDYPPTLGFPIIVDPADPNLHTSPVVPVPNFARAVSFLPIIDSEPSTVFSSDTKMFVYINSGGQTAQTIFGNRMLSFPGGYPLCAESRYWQISKTVGGAAEFWVQFELGL